MSFFVQFNLFLNIFFELNEINYSILVLKEILSSMSLLKKKTFSSFFFYFYL
jgi:hypothetical protein